MVLLLLRTVGVFFSFACVAFQVQDILAWTIPILGAFLDIFSLGILTFAIKKKNAFDN